jgi:hypothetical protein
MRHSCHPAGGDAEVHLQAKDGFRLWVCHIFRIIFFFAIPTDDSNWMRQETYSSKYIQLCQKYSFHTLLVSSEGRPLYQIRHGHRVAVDNIKVNRVCFRFFCHIPYLFSFPFICPIHDVSLSSTTTKAAPYACHKVLFPAVSPLQPCR